FDRGSLVKNLADNLGNGLSSYFPLYLMNTATGATLFEQPRSNEPKANLSEGALCYLARIGADEHDLFFHALAVLHAPAYRAENSGALRQDWPRVPLPADREVLASSAALGRQLAALLNSEEQAPGVTAGTVRRELRTIGAPARLGGGQLQESDLALTVGWGHAGQGGVTMPGKGKAVERPYGAEELGALTEGGAELGMDQARMRELLGESTLDIYLNGVAYWRNIPLNVWSYTIGGYQAIKKWLSYREQPLLGRPLRLDEVREVQHMVRRVAAILLLGPALDASYASTALATAPWKASGEGRLA
ncbi:MAG: type ISP restriction/modification enzyme, partial [Chloroflexota bacterium]